MNNIEQKTYYANLFSYYKDLFTEKQQYLFDCYYNQDYSLAEIAEESGISRNAVWDSLKKVTKALDEYEKCLNLFNKDQKLKHNLDELKKHCDEDGLILIKELEEME